MELEQLEKLLESNQQLVARLDARNEALEKEVQEIRASAKAVAEMKP
jgi:F0F1-type ATP synthase membrane subunit b/b'